MGSVPFFFQNRVNFRSQILGEGKGEPPFILNGFLKFLRNIWYLYIVRSKMSLRHSPNCLTRVLLAVTPFLDKEVAISLNANRLQLKMRRGFVG